MSEIKFPCCVDCKNLNMEQRLDLQKAFEKLGVYVWDYANSYDKLPYYGVDSNGTSWYNHISSFSGTGEESEVSVYAYKEVMAATGVEGTDSSLSDDNTATLVENEYSGSSVGESGCNQIVGASNEFSIKKEYSVYHNGLLILEGDAEYLLKIKEIIEEELG